MTAARSERRATHHTTHHQGATMETTDLRRVIEQQLALSHKLRARIRELEDSRSAPLAIVGMGLRLPGGLTTPEDYWDFLLGDGDAVGAIPGDRPGLRAVHAPGGPRPGRSYVDRAGFLDAVDRFDPAFFGISQREAEVLDPQQRLLLETSWEAMERAGIPVRRHDRLPAGVFVGLMTSDYGDRLAHREDTRAAIDPYYGTGGGHAMAAGRVAYVMGLSGPAVTMDTACSSSLVALHGAARSLRSGECRYALVGGANVFFSPDLMVSLCQSRALAPDGRSKAFLDSADGYGRGEGVGTVVLMRLADAEAEGRPVLAVLRGTAVNHDGASSGLTVPNGPAQAEVVRAALADAGVAPEEVGYVEAHGTGTSLGDPIEAGALDGVLGSGAPARPAPLALGTVKARIGHLESAAGIAGLIKVVLMLRAGRIPASSPERDGPLNHLIPWQRMKLHVPRRTEDWPDGYGGRRVAGISALGMSGTNAHAVLESYRPAPADAVAGPLPAAPAAGTAPRPELITLSARHPESLAALVDRTVTHLRQTPGDRLAPVCATLREGRAAFEHRIAVTGGSAGELADALARSQEARRRGGTMPPAAVRLRLGPDRVLIEKGLNDVLTSFPSLRSDGDATDEAGTVFRRLLCGFGLRAEEGRALPASAANVAEVSWDGGAAPLLNRVPEAAPGLLLEALAELFRAGADLRLHGLRGPGTRLDGDLPTYPFRHRSCWIDEPAPGGADGPAHGPADAGTATADATADAAAATADAAAGTAAAGAGGEDALAAVTAFLGEELARIMRTEEQADPALSFLDAGGDSFTAMQLTVAIEERYQVEVPVDEVDIELPLSDLFERLGRCILDNSAQEDGS
ncbi:type I polyketide synthase [Streptomyces sp. YIM 98790]|uniref:type I polyketide synthase n=1 Tax=Streptomyces sp. YIM 98790 TaxID=2689077 RepID=UPI001A9D92BE|nr:type I polyketide synthase [Streptomyces sp. YIM 98790]